jgi:peptide/nickel transport system permease protein
MAVGERVTAYDYEERPELSTVELTTKEKLLVIARNNKLATVGAGTLALTLIGAFILPLFYEVDPLATNSQATLQPPSAGSPFGTDTFGRDILARIIHAAQLDFFIAFSVTLLALVIGASIGAVAGYAGGLVDDVVMRFVDLMLSFPAFILALAITVMLGNEIRYVIAAIAFAYVPHFVRLTRGEVLKIRDSEYAEAARVVGNPAWRVAFRHVFPNAMAPALVFASIVLGWAILDASALGFLGIGIKPPTPEWGTMVAEGSDEIFSGSWWTWLFPGLAILAVVVAFNWLGDGLRNLLRSA